MSASVVTDSFEALILVPQNKFTILGLTDKLSLENKPSDHGRDQRPQEQSQPSDISLRAFVEIIIFFEENAKGSCCLFHLLN